MFRRHHEKRSINILFVIFRVMLSAIMLAVLVAGIYSAYKHFSAVDPIKLDPQALLSEFLAGKVPKDLLGVFSKVKITQGLSNQISQKVLGEESSKQIPSDTSPKKPPSGNPAFKFLLVADSHGDNTSLDKAINQAKKDFPDLKFIIGLGDYTKVGTIQELKDSKSVFDAAALRYFLIPGDHDLWDCRNRSLHPPACFEQVFGPAYQSFTFDNFKFLLLNNSDNYMGFDDKEQQWISQELESRAETKGMLVFVHEPLFHPSSDHVMGWVDKSLKSQARQFIFQLNEVKVTEIFAGDIHYFSEYQEPQTDLNMVTIGAVTSDRNPQAPRFAVVSVFDDGKIKVEDVEIK